MRDRFPLLVIGGLVLLVVLGSFLSQGAARGSFADTLSTYRSEPDGARALYLLAEAQGVPVGRLQTDLQSFDETQNLILLAVEFSERSTDEEEHPSFFHTLPDGGVDDDDQDPLKQQQEAEENRLHKGRNVFRSSLVGVTEREKVLEHVRKGGTLVYFPWGHRENPLLKAIDVHLWKADRELGPRTLVPSQPSPWTAGVEKLEAKVQSYLDLPPGSVPLLHDYALNEYVAGMVPYGLGQVVVVGAPELAMNKNLTVADNAVFWASLLRTASATGPVQFDEYHHGFTNDRSIANFGRRYGLQFAALQVILGVCLWAGSLRRFGRPKKHQQDVRVGSTDTLYATSRLYREGRHSAHAAAAIVKQLSAELAPVAGLALKTEPREVAAALEARGRPELSAALLETYYRAQAAGTDADVTEVASKAALTRRLVHRKKRQTAAPQKEVG